MARVRGKNTVPELLVRRALWAAGIRYRLHARGLPGRPDLAIAKHKVAIFVHGCFWHRHEGCPGNRMPKSNVEFWDTKLGGNVVRDEANVVALAGMGWRAAVIWECDARSPDALKAFVVAIGEMVSPPT